MTNNLHCKSCFILENIRILSFAMEESCFLNFFLRQYLKQWKLHAVLNNLCCTVLSAVRTCYCIILLWCCWKSSHIVICQKKVVSWISSYDNIWNNESYKLYWIICCVVQFCQLLERVIVSFCCENLHVLSSSMGRISFSSFSYDNVQNNKF